ncbi:MAG: hypothetical protein KA098_06610, partial [Phenylobacterium sp.]|nr:hypothetical protein [Phenylobacterium sp.]
GLIHPTSAVCATTDTARGEKRLPSEQKAGDLEVKRRATWGMSAQTGRSHDRCNEVYCNPKRKAPKQS